VIVGRFTDGANVSIEGEMGVKSDAKNFDNETEQPATSTERLTCAK